MRRPVPIPTVSFAVFLAAALPLLVARAQPLPAAAPAVGRPIAPPIPVPAILVSRQLAEQAQLQTGDVVTLATDAAGSRTARFRVAGVYEPTPDPMRFSMKRLDVQLHLPDLLALTADPADPLSRETVGALNVALVHPGDAAEVAEAVRARAPGLVVRPTARASDGSDPFAVLEKFHWAIAVVTVLGSTAFLLALMVMRAEERRDIIGIMRLMGVSGRSILLEVLLEGFLIAVAGAIFGVVIAALSQGLVNRFFQWRYDTTLVFMRVTPSIAWRSIGFAVPLGVGAGLVSSWALLRRGLVALVRR